MLYVPSPIQLTMLLQYDQFFQSTTKGCKFKLDVT